MRQCHTADGIGHTSAACHDQLFADFRRTPRLTAFLRYDALIESGTDLSLCFADLGALWACSSRHRELSVLIYGTRVASAIEARAACAEQQAWDTASRQRRIRRRGSRWPPPYPAQLTLIETYGWPCAVDTMGVCHAAPYCFACRALATDSWRAMSAYLGSNRHVCYFCRYNMGSRTHRDGAELAQARRTLVFA